MIDAGLNPDYVLDRMQMYEIQPLMSNIYRKHRESWEQTRFLGYLIAQTNSTKKLKPSDIIKFFWDSETPNEDKTISAEDISRLKEKAKQFLKNN